jgi:hypothetical protein
MNAEEIRGPEVVVAIAYATPVSAEAEAAGPAYVMPIAVASPVIEPEVMRMSRGPVLIAHAVRVTNEAPPAARRRAGNEPIGFRNRVMPVDGAHKVRPK